MRKILEKYCTKQTENKYKFNSENVYITNSNIVYFIENDKVRLFEDSPEILELCFMNKLNLI